VTSCGWPPERITPGAKHRAALERAIADANTRLDNTAVSGAERHGPLGPLIAADPVAAELEAALALRQAGADTKTLRRALRRIEELLGPPSAACAMTARATAVTEMLRAHADASRRPGGRPGESREPRGRR
jgi:hypothetical protein